MIDMSEILNTAVIELTLTLKCNFIFSVVGFAEAVIIIHTGTMMKELTHDYITDYGSNIKWNTTSWHFHVVILTIA